MAMDKQFRRIEAKLDALLEKAGLKPEDFADVPRTPRAPRELTPQEQEAIDNAPKAEASAPDTDDAPRVTAQGAPDTSASVPKEAKSKGKK